MELKLKPHQISAIRKMHNGCILCGGTGSGKSITGLAYYFIQNGGTVEPMTKMKNPKDLYIITTAKKRDSGEWVGDMSWFYLTPDDETKIYDHKVVIDSWNNIKKYASVQNSFFIFDEQRVVGYGAWTKAFLKIAKSNDWILLSATPGDNYMDYMPVFIANGFYKNKSEFTAEHCVYSRFSKFPQIERFIGTERLNRLRRRVLVDMPYQNPAAQYHEDVWCSFDKEAYKDLMKNRFDYEKGEPIENVSELCYKLRKICYTDESRAEALRNIFEEHNKLIVFYNFDYELEIIKNIDFGEDVVIAELNGHRHDPEPFGNLKWIYLVQYNAGSEAWNCIKTDTMIFYSQNYSYKMMKQASGRIDRLTTPYKELKYFHLKCRSPIELRITRALAQKKNFNESAFIK
jgi:hypothetical protein